MFQTSDLVIGLLKLSLVECGLAGFEVVHSFDLLVIKATIQDEKYNGTTRFFNEFGTIHRFCWIFIEYFWTTH
jgi:hypothetical protein